MLHGYWFKLLRVNLTTRKVYREKIPESVLTVYLGGAGLGTKILYDEVDGSTDPLGPENRLIFATGPFQGTGVPGSGKWAIVSKSPMTGTFAVTTAGADWGYRFKKTGYDAVCIEGKAAAPVYLAISDSGVSIEDASELWGQDALEATKALKARAPSGTSVAAIGQAGENQVAAACVVVDGHSFAGRCGLGAVMGSKNLKAITVCGNKEVSIADKEKLAALITAAKKVLKENTRETFWKHGTSILVTSCEAVGDLPIKYWSGDVWPEGAEKLGAPAYTERLKAKPWPCRSCPVGCHNKIEYEVDGRLKSGAGAEYESLGMLGSCCLVDDLIAVTEANDLCNRLGLDTISAGSYVAFTMECYEKGYITGRDTGYPVVWGDANALLNMIQEIGSRQGFGARFAGGIVPAAHQIGPEAEELAVHVKGLDLPAHDPRTYYSLALNYATGTRGACHLRGFPHIGESGMTVPELGLTKISERFSLEGKANLAIVFQDMCAVLDALVCCMFMQCCGLDLTQTAAMLSAVTGRECTAQELMEIGERIFNLQRLINVRDGYRRESDRLPKRMFEPAAAGFRARKAPYGFEKALDEYYKLRGWDEDGVPTAAKIQYLRLGDDYEG